MTKKIPRSKLKQNQFGSHDGLPFVYEYRGKIEAIICSFA